MRILFVCMGNICRSPTAEGVFRRALAVHGIDTVEVDSAGTHDFHVGDPPDRRAVAAAARRGIDLSSLRARTLEPEDFERFDLILAMDDDNLRELRDRVPAGQEKRIRLVMDFADAATRRTIPDPYYGGPHGFEEVLDLLEEAAQGLLEHVRQRGRAVR